MKNPFNIKFKKEDQKYDADRLLCSKCGINSCVTESVISPQGLKCANCGNVIVNPDNEVYLKQVETRGL